MSAGNGFYLTLWLVLLRKLQCLDVLRTIGLVDNDCFVFLDVFISQMTPSKNISSPDTSSKGKWHLSRVQKVFGAPTKHRSLGLHFSE